MKRLAVLSMAALLGAQLFAQEATAEDNKNSKTLINFTELTAGGANVEKSALNYGAYLGVDRKSLESTVINLEIKNWDVVFPASYKNTKTLMNSYVRDSKVSDDSSMFQGQSVLGARINFPAGRAYADIMPPFSIPAYTANEESGKREGQFDNMGVVKNVGLMKEMRVTVLGRLYDHNMSVILENEKGETKEYYLGSLKHIGWKTLVWKNMDYQIDVRDREFKKGDQALYPNSLPFIKLKGFRVYQNDSSKGGDFITYIGDVQVDFDTFRLEEQENDIDDESIWNLDVDRNAEGTKVLLIETANYQRVKELEQKRMNTSLDVVTPPVRTEAAAPAAN